MNVRVTLGVLAIVLGADIIAGQGWWWPRPWYTGEYPDVYPEDVGAYVWSNRESWIPESYAPCVVKNSNGDVEGTCTHSVDCKLSGGRSVARGNCSLLSTCCTHEKTCGQTAKSRVVRFKNPKNPRKDEARRCSLKVERVNDNVCQMRVDIEKMNLRLPKGTKTVPYTVTCDDDKFTVSGISSNVRPPTLCGKNTKTHFYIHLNAEQTHVSLEAFLVGNSDNIDIVDDPEVNPNLKKVDPEWDMKITQLECPSRQKRFDFQKKKENPNQIYLDFAKLAPAGCLQYFTEHSGTVRSFGWDDALTLKSLVTPQNYAICFKNDANCGMTYSFNEDDDPILLRIENPELCDKEYLYLTGQTTPKVCLVSADIENVNHIGPASIQFVSTGVSLPIIDAGFKLNFKTRTNCRS